MSSRTSRLSDFFDSYTKDLTDEDLQDGFRLTGLFLLRHVLEPRGQGHSDARAGFINALTRQQVRAAVSPPMR